MRLSLIHIYTSLRAEDLVIPCPIFLGCQTALGMTVGAESKLVEIDGRRLVFKITAYDKAGVIGTAEHERMIVDSDRMLKKAADRFNA